MILLRMFAVLAWVLVIFNADAQVSSGEGFTPMEGVAIPKAQISQPPADLIQLKGKPIQNNDNENYEYFVQIGAFREKIDALELLNNTESMRIFKIFISESESRIFRVRAGPFFNREAAFEISKKFKDRGIDSAVIKHDLKVNELKPSKIKLQPLRDAVAIIIGIGNYKQVSKADFASDDARSFYDYALRALGIKPENIKLLFDEGADDVEILGAFKKWLPMRVRKGKTEVIVFFSGHSIPSHDRKSFIFLPWNFDKDFVDKTAINKHEIISSLQAVQPKSVTMFLDGSYIGQTIGSDKLMENHYPSNFTVISASAFDQISSSSHDLRHGIFSYYLMKGMEGDADLNKDSKITVAEMQEYLTEMVGRQAMGMNRKQQPQLFGDADKVLVGR